MRSWRRAGAVIASSVVILAGLAAVSASPAAAADGPPVGGCYDYPFSTIGKASSAAPRIGCESPHTAETFLIGIVNDSVGLPSKTSHAARLAIGKPCTVARMNDYLGFGNRSLPSRFRSVVLLPTDAQWNAGERWFRCDVVLQGGLALKQFSGTAAALVSANPSTQFDFCTPGQPNAKNTAAYPCVSPKKNWIKVLDHELGGAGSKFPGTSKVERTTRNLCEKQGKRWSAKQKYPGWWAIWPTSVGWAEGRRSAQCFVPYSQYLKQLAIDNKPKPTPAPTPIPIDPPPAAT